MGETKYNHRQYIISIGNLKGTYKLSKDCGITEPVKVVLK